jgi:hypothetical protein
MTESDRVVQALRSAANEAERSAPPTEVAWQQIQRRVARQQRRHWIGRIAAILVPLFAAGGIATGAIEAYAPASRPPEQVIVPPPATTLVARPTLPVATTLPVPTTLPVTTGSPLTTAQPTATTRPPSRTRTVAPAPTTTPISRAAGTPLTSVAWASINYPFGCGTTLQGAVGYRVVQVAYPESAPGRKVAIVMVECNAGAGTPPVELLVYDGASSPLAPHLAQTLIAVSSRYQASRFTASGATLAVNVNGFSSAAVPNCCPDVHETLTWHWTASGYQPGP